MSRSRALSWTFRILGGLVVLIVLAVAAVRWRAAEALSRVHEVPRTFSTAGGSPERGEHVVRAVAACAACHGEDLGGKLMIDAPPFMRLPAPNLTAGHGGIAASLQPADWERAVRHGVGREGRGLLMMPSDAYSTLTDGDLADAIAYLRTLPPVDRDLPERSIGPAGRVMLAMNPQAAMAALRIDHAAAAPPPPSDAVGRGAYLAMTCRGCHGPGLEGLNEGIEPDTPPPPNLTAHPESPTASWTEADFVRALRTGRLPDGREIHPVMPWRAFAALTDDELSALWAYTRSVPPRPPPKRG